MAEDPASFELLRADARAAAERLAALIARAVSLDVQPPRLLAGAAWELWEFARAPAKPKGAGLPWVGTFRPTTAEADMRRREFLAGAAAATGALATEALAGSQPVGPEAVRGAVEATDRLRGAVAVGAARDYLGPLLRHAQAVRGLAVAAPTESLRRGLWTAYGESLTVLAWVAGDGRQSTLAARYCQQALDAAEQASDRDLGAYTQAILALLTLHQRDDPYGALRLVGAGMDQARHAAPATRAYLAAVAAEAQSIAGSRSRTLAALDRAEALLEQADSGSTPTWLRQFAPSRLASYRGACYVRIGRARQAKAVLEDALAEHAAGNDQVYPLADLAGAHARLQEPEQACAALGRAAGQVRGARSAMRLERLYAARAHLDRWQGERFVRDLDEQLASTAATV
ncbi:MAG TPA: hypothetical protein VFD04_19450 [Actinomycetes bacterium]|nr:hypothetical protein [Actinomycetes bacterium]